MGDYGVTMKDLIRGIEGIAEKIICGNCDGKEENCMIEVNGFRVICREIEKRKKLATAIAESLVVDERKTFQICDYRIVRVVDEDGRSMKGNMTRQEVRKALNTAMEEC